MKEGGMCDDGLKKNNNIINNVSSQVFKSTQHHNKIYMDGEEKKTKIKIHIACKHV